MSALKQPVPLLQRFVARLTATLEGVRRLIEWHLI